LSQIDKVTFGLDIKNYHNTKTEKKQIILGGSLRKDSNHIIHLQNKDFGQSKRWPTYSITREGKIHQHYDPTFYSDYMGNKDIDKKSVSIVLENMGMLYYDTDKEHFINWINEECNEKLVGEKLWKNGRYWEDFSLEQYLSLSKLIKEIVYEFNIKLDLIGHNVLDTETDFNTFSGVFCRSNYNTEYLDLNPLFDFQRFQKLINVSG
jgi:N-acetyl-anhydromuramyl-L-alanine amidase AmpD